MAQKADKAIVLSKVSLTESQRKMMMVSTPREFIKERKARGGKQVKYVEGGYVVSKLNELFGPINWEFEVLDEQVTDKDVTIRGKLTIKDHVNGYSISKTQYGGHDRDSNIPLGDTKKAAATDALKKCATLFGIALDVYWGQLDEEKKREHTEKAQGKMTQAEMFQQSKKLIEACNEQTTLKEWRERIEKSKNYPDGPKKVLLEMIDAKIKQS